MPLTVLRPALFGVLGLATAAILPASALAQVDAEKSDRERATISVTGEGEAAVAPDMAVLTLTVLREAETASQALDLSNAAMQDVLDALKAQDIANRDLQTSGFSINPQYVYPEDGTDRRPRITGYEVANSLTVRLRELDLLGEVLDEAVSLGVNQGGNIEFTNDDPAAALEDARRGAVEDATARARTLADAAGVTLGRVLSIDESLQRPEPMPIARAEMRMAADSSVPVVTGENLYRITVNMRFEIEQPAAE